MGQALHPTFDKTRFHAWYPELLVFPPPPKTE
jgi:hypothetical protein